MRTPFGYDKVGYYYEKDEEAHKALHEAFDLLEAGTPYREAADYVIIESGRWLSHEGLRKLYKRFKEGTLPEPKGIFDER